MQRVDRAFGASNSYTRFTAIGRHYYPLAARLTLAQRAVVQQASGAIPLYDIATIQTSYKQQEGLGGNSSIRGLPKNRFVGKGLVMLNTDLRWRFAEFSLRHKPAHLVLIQTRGTTSRCRRRLEHDNLPPLRCLEVVFELQRQDAVVR